MRRHRLPLLVVLVGCLSCSLSALQAKAPPGPIVGTWTLVGFGDANAVVVTPDKLEIVINPSGTFDYRISEDGAGTPYKVSGNWTFAGDRLTMTPWNGESMKARELVYRVAWDGGTLLLHDEEDGNRAPPPERFARKLGTTP